jgi:hypothetical protein
MHSDGPKAHDIFSHVHIVKTPLLMVRVEASVRPNLATGCRTLDRGPDAGFWPGSQRVAGLEALAA